VGNVMPRILATSLSSGSFPADKLNYWFETQKLGGELTGVQKLEFLIRTVGPLAKAELPLPYSAKYCILTITIANVSDDGFTTSSF